MEKLNAEVLIERWGVPVAQGRYSVKGKFYEDLTKFPGALFHPSGYVIFETEEEYLNCDRLSRSRRKNGTYAVNVPNPGIESFPQYKLMA